MLLNAIGTTAIAATAIRTTIRNTTATIPRMMPMISPLDFFFSGCAKAAPASEVFPSSFTL